MPVSSTSIPKLRHHKASGQAAVVIDGRWHYLGQFGSPQAQERYDRIVSEWLSAGRRSPRVVRQPTVAELILAYWRYASERYVDDHGKPKKELFHIKVAMRRVRQLYGTTSADEFGPRALITIQQGYVEAGYCRTMVNDYVRRVRRMFKWATAREMIPPSIYHGLQAVDGLRAGESTAREPRDVNPVPQEWIDAVLLHLSRQTCGMVKLQLVCGARPGEIVRLRAADIDMSGTFWVYRPRHHKTSRFGKGREIYIGPRGQAIIQEFLKPDVNAYLFSPADADRERREAIHAARKTEPRSSELKRRRKARPRRKPGARYTADSYRRAIWRACDLADAEARGGGPPFICKRCGHTYDRFGFLRRHAKRCHGEAITLELRGQRAIPRWSPNRLRHNFATRVRQDYGIEAARVLLGHSSVGTTEIYSERDTTLALNVIGRVG